jgi:hypothetical protein
MLFRCVVVSLALTMLFSGCGDNGGRVPVTGTVNFDGKPLEDGSVVFSGDKGAAGIGKIVNGSFSLSESGEQEGVQPGTYTVLIQSWFEELGSVLPSGGFSPGKPRIPLDYMDVKKSGLTAEVKAGQSNRFTFEIVSKPKENKK